MLEPSAATITERQRAYTLFMLVLVFTSSHVDRQIMGILGEPIKLALGLSDTQLGLLTGISFALFYAGLGVPMAMWADRNNRRNLISFSVFVWSLMTAMCALAQNFFQLLLARIGVGVGEAGSSPPSHSIIADLYPPERRATAMAIFGTGINWGILIGFLVGGWINEWYGWRAAFLVVGLPGLLLALIVRFTVKEPSRGYSERLSADLAPPGFGVVLRFLLGDAVLRNIVIAGTLIAFTGYAAVIWVPIYIARIHELGTGTIGTTLALQIGVGGAIGIYLGGRLADYLGEKYGTHWLPWVVAIASIITVPFLWLAFFAGDAFSAFAAYALPAALGTIYIGPGFALIQNRTPVHMRSVAAAINLFVVNIIGLGAGPFFVGVMSDYFEPRFGIDGLRYALACTLVVVIWGTLHYVLAGVHLRRERIENR